MQVGTPLALHPDMRTIVAAAALLPLIACGLGEVPDNPDNDEESSDPLAGRYELVTTYDLSAGEGAPSIFGDVLGPLSGIREDPAGTVFEILEASGDGIANLLDLLPPDLRANLEQQINNYVNQQIAAGGTAGEVIIWIDDIAGVLTHFEVVSEFEIGRADAAGIAEGTHTLGAVRFQFQGETQTVPINDLISTLTVARDVDIEMVDASGGVEVAIADHAFHLPLGELAVVGFNALLERSLGATSVNDALTQLVDCPSLAASVGPQCLGDFCIGETEIANVCAKGLEAVGNEIEKAVGSIDFAELRLSSGRAAVQGVTKDDGLLFGQVDRWSGGAWSSQLDLSGLALPVGATFEATRL